MEHNPEERVAGSFNGSQRLGLLAISFALLSFAFVPYVNGDHHLRQTRPPNTEFELQQDDTSDSCNFADPAVDFYPYDAVRACYDRIDAREKDLTQFVQAGRAFIEMSSLRNVYDERFQWRTKFDELATFPVATSKDWELQLAIAQTIITGFKNGPRSSDRPLYAFITSAIGERPQYNLLKINILNFSGILPYALISH